MISEFAILNASILIVDDRAANVELLDQLLRDTGYTNITSTMDPFTACPLHTRHKYDVILLDLNMPGMDGFEVMEKLKEAGADDYLPVIVLTAEPRHKLRALQSGAKDFISKPFDLLEVKTRIYNMLEVRLLYKKMDNYSRLLEMAMQQDAADTGSIMSRQFPEAVRAAGPQSTSA